MSSEESGNIENRESELNDMNCDCDFQYDEGLDGIEEIEDLHLVEAIMDYGDYIVVHKRNEIEKYGKCNGKYKRFFKIGYWGLLQEVV